MKAENDRRDFQEETTELKDLIEANTDKTILERIRMLSNLIEEEPPKIEVEISFEGAGNANSPAN